MGKNINEIIASHSNAIQRLSEQKSRYIKKLNDLEIDIRKGMGHGSILLLDWARDVKFYLENDIDAKVNYESMIKEYELFVAELIGYFDEAQQSDAANLELQRLVDELGKKVRSLTNEIRIKNDELSSYKDVVVRRAPKTIPEPLEDEQEDVYDEPVEEPEQPEMPEEKPKPKPKPNPQIMSEGEPIIENPPEQGEEPSDRTNKGYITNSMIFHLKRSDSTDYEINKIEAFKIRHSHSMFSDYSTVEHRYYKAVTPSFKVKTYTFNVTNDNMCRVCKRPISINKVACGAVCRNVNRRFKTWISRHTELLTDVDLRPVIVRKKKAEQLRKSLRNVFNNKSESPDAN